jgi:hypothetical protein
MLWQQSGSLIEAAAIRALFGSAQKADHRHQRCKVLLRNLKKAFYAI